MTVPSAVLAVVEDMFFVPRIESVAKALGIPLKVLDQFSSNVLSDFTEQLKALQPALVIFDLNNRSIDWEGWIKAMKAQAEFAHIPVLVFGSHKDIAVMKAAKEAGADQVVAKSRFVQEMADLISKYL